MSRAEITTPEVLTEESAVELSLRPRRLSEFIGQQKVKDGLTTIDEVVRETIFFVHYRVLAKLGRKEEAAVWLERSYGEVNTKMKNLPPGAIPGDIIDRNVVLRQIVEEWRKHKQED